MGGPGVQRAVKFGKYLPQWGWDVTFLTVKDVVYHIYDPGLSAALPSETKVVRTSSADPLRLAFLFRQLRSRSRPDKDRVVSVRPDSATKSQVLKIYRSLQSWLFVVDPQILWLPFAVAAAVKAIRNQHVAAVMAMPQPSSTAIAGYIAAAATGKPFVLDMRDPWTQDPYFKMPTPLHRAANQWLERRVLRRADQIVVISESMRQAIVKRYPDLDGRVSVITNGFDAEDFAAPARLRESGSFDIVYTGSLYAHHVPVFRLFCSALKSLLDRRPDLRSRVRLRLVGRIEHAIAQVLEEEQVVGVTQVTGYLPHTEAIAYTKSADLLLLIIKSDLDPGRDVITIPGKFFEYMASRRPILYLGPQSEASAILERTGQGKAVSLDRDEIARELERNIDEPVAGGIDQTIVDSYERRDQARRMAQVLDRARQGHSVERPGGRNVGE
jgi:glycosyltransferase involved in cell wall biosynthesis